MTVWEWASVCVCVLVGTHNLTHTNRLALYSADGQKAVIVLFNWAFTAAFWAATWREQVPSDYTL